MAKHDRKKFKQKITKKTKIGVGTSTGKTFVPFASGLEALRAGSVAFCSICPNLIRGTSLCRPGISSPPANLLAAADTPNAL
jgi:hypothetical protein